MAEGRRYALAPQLDINQILKEAQQRWLRPAEICEILKNYRNFRIAPEPPNRPPSGSLFIFDRKVLRYFRKDGHNWRKKKDGKTVKEAHERLKAGSVDVLHCYYAHGQDNECFQRRSYWMLEEHLMHIVLVHYLEVKGGRSNLHRIREVEHSNNADSPLNSSSFTSQNHLPSQNTEAESSISGQTSEYEDAESVLQFNASVSKAKFNSAQNFSSGGPGYHAFPQMQREYANGSGPIINPSLSNPFAVSPSDNLHIGGEFREIASSIPLSELYMSQEELAKAFGQPGVDTSVNGPTVQLNLSAWDDVADHSTVTTSMQTPSFDISFTSTQHIPFGEDDIKFDNLLFDGAYANDFDLKEGDIPSIDLKSQWEILPDDYLLQERPEDDKADNPPFPPLEKGDSFNRWMSKELEEVDSKFKTNSDTLWNTVEAEGVLENTGGSSHCHLDTYTVGPMISQDQLFSIIDYSPSWAYVGMTTKVLLMGRFLKGIEEANRYKLSCMFGEIEVPADILADGTLRCYALHHIPGRVPFYVTCSNRLACSEVREFEFRAMDSQFMEISDPYNRITDEMYLSMRLEKLLTLGPNVQQTSVVSPTKEKQELCNKIGILMSESDEWSNLLKLIDEGLGILGENPQDELVERLMKEKLYLWLLHKVNEEGKGPSVLDKDKEGQGVIHLAAALGYDWAIRSIITAGVNINFRDANGWTALHWAAFCGREKTVVALVALGAAPGLLTDPTPESPSGRTPADLASSNNHKGISGFLAESSLTSLLEILTLKDSKSADLARAHTVRTGPSDVNNPTDDVSLKDSLSAVRNSAQTVARIYQVYRMQSFQRKQLKEFDDDGPGISDEQVLAIASAKAMKKLPGDMQNLAATRIQNKFRGYKGRKEFLLIKQRIVKIQAHVRGHQVRKHYRKIIWSVGIVEKIILRWRRRGSGLRGFRSEGASLEGPSKIQNQPAKADDDDFLKEGRRQTEVRLEKALARVKSMVQYPEARDQYSRLLTVVTKLQESQAMQERMLKESEEADEVGDFMAEFRELWEDDMLMTGFN